MNMISGPRGGVNPAKAAEAESGEGPGSGATFHSEAKRFIFFLKQVSFSARQLKRNPFS